MSVCVGIIKTVGVSSLGLYTGLLTSSYLISKNITACENSELKNKIICKLSKVGLVLLGLSTVFLGVGYFKVPLRFKQPYTLYGFLVGPLTGLYSLMFSKCPYKTCPVTKKEGECPVAKKECPMKTDINLPRHLLVLLTATLPVFCMNVLGLYGEGVF
ncbi:hypothetical protein ACO0OL_003822 [Hanseniaspora opuntiae]|jgi:autophagy-related protein 33|uniref:Autophagy-related protein 33 n=1 Tax=Hanseniaspora opuntiae TaxID=211096 RepID=A0A1E5RLG5_9ASCO|nr:Autophagy-related protein 33 [Hanseniaspora opuntiae]